MVGAALLTYLLDRDDVRWRCVKEQGHASQAGTLYFHHRSSVDRTRGGNLHLGPYRKPRSSWGSELHAFRSHPRCLGELCNAFGLGSLVSGGGFVIFVGGEALRVFRLIRRDAQNPQPQSIVTVSLSSCHEKADHGAR